MAAAASVNFGTICHGCRGEQVHQKLFQCGGCGLVSYGSQACKDQDERVHRAVCRKIFDIEHIPSRDSRLTKAAALCQSLLDPLDPHDPALAACVYNKYIRLRTADSGRSALDADPYNPDVTRELSIVVYLMSSLQGRVKNKDVEGKLKMAMNHLQTNFSLTKEDAKARIDLHFERWNSPGSCWTKGYKKFFKPSGD